MVNDKKKNLRSSSGFSLHASEYGGHIEECMTSTSGRTKWARIAIAGILAFCLPSLISMTLSTPLPREPPKTPDAIQNTLPSSQTPSNEASSSPVVSVGTKAIALVEAKFTAVPEQSESSPAPIVDVNPTFEARKALPKKLKYDGHDVVLKTSELQNFPFAATDITTCPKCSGLGPDDQPPPPTFGRNVVFAMKYTEWNHVIRQWLRMPASLRATGSNALLVIFCRNKHVDLMQKEFGRFGNVHVIGFKDHPLITSARWWISSVRFTLARLFLDYHSELFDAVMTSDILDVVFQLDPFEWARKEMLAKEKGIIVAEEPAIMGRSKQSDNGVNLQWSLACGAVVSHLRGKSVLCSGTTIGNATWMAQYLARMDEKGRTAQCSGLAMDQGAHNVLMYDKPFSKQTIPHGYQVGRIMTMNGATEAWYDRCGRLCNRNGEPYVLTHQINRCYWIRKFHRVSEEKLFSSMGLSEMKDLEHFGCDQVEWPPFLSVPEPKVRSPNDKPIATRKPNTPEPVSSWRDLPPNPFNPDTKAKLKNKGVNGRAVSNPKKR